MKWLAQIKQWMRDQAIRRAVEKEMGGGVLKSQIYVDKDKRLVSPSNPEGLLVANRRDEPEGGFQGVDRKLAEGGVVAGIPNFRAGGGGLPPVPTPNPGVWQQIVASTKAFASSIGQAAKNLATAVFGAQAVNGALTRAAAAGGVLKKVAGDLLSPLGLAAGLALGLAIGLYKAVTNSQLLADALGEAADREVYSGQFKALLGDTAAAEKRLKSLAAFAQGSPFRFDDVVDASKRLQILTRGALTGTGAMKMVADAAAIAGVSMADSAAVIGGAWEDIFSGRGAGNAIDQLKQLGMVSAATADKLKLMEMRGLKGKGLWSAISAELAKNKGMADALSQSIQGLNNELDNTRGNQLASIGAMFAKGQKDGIRTAIVAWKEFGPVLKEILAPFAALFNAINSFILFIVKATASIPGFKSAIVALGRAILFLVAALALLGAVQGLQMLVGLVRIVLPLARSLLAAGAASSRFGAALSFIGKNFIKFLGPIGAAIGLLSMFGDTIMSLAQKIPGLGAALEGMGFGGGAKDTFESAQEMAQKIAAAQSGSSTPGEKAELISEAETQFREAQEKRREAQKKAKQGKTAGDYATNIATGAAIGATIGSAVPVVGTAAGAVAGGAIGGAATFLDGIFGQDSRQQAADEASAAEAEARKQRDAARNMPNKPPEEFMNTPAYQKAAAEAEGMLNDANAMQDALDQWVEALKASGAEIDAATQAEIDARQEAIDALRAEAAARVSPEQIKKDQDNQNTADKARGAAMEKIGEVTGNQSMVQEGRDLQDEADIRQKTQDYISQGMDPAQAESTAKQEVLASRLEKEQQGYNTFASGIGAVGGAAGEVGGTGSTEEARLLRELIRVVEQDPGQSAAAMPSALANNQR